MSESGATEQEPDPTRERLTQRRAAGEPDVLLDIPEVTVDQIRLAVDGLDADLSLRARLANLLQIDAGVRVHLEGVELDVTGVSAEALLKVRLEKLAQILERALATIDRNPQVIDALARTAAVSIDDVNRAAQQLTGGAGAPVVNREGQHLGTVGAVADRALREQVGEPGPPPAAPPVPSAGPQPPEPPTGAQAQQPGPRPGGAEEPSKAGPGGPGGPSKAGPAGPPEGAEVAGKPGPTEGGGAQPGPPSEEPAQAGAGVQGRHGRGRAEGAPGTAQTAGETLRQAGRSVWEAIQGGMGQGRQHRPKR